MPIFERNYVSRTPQQTSELEHAYAELTRHYGLIGEGNVNISSGVGGADHNINISPADKSSRITEVFPGSDASGKLVRSTPDFVVVKVPCQEHNRDILAMVNYKDRSD